MELKKLKLLGFDSQNQPQEVEAEILFSVSYQSYQLNLGNSVSWLTFEDLILLCGATDITKSNYLKVDKDNFKCFFLDQNNLGLQNPQMFLKFPLTEAFKLNLWLNTFLVKDSLALEDISSAVETKPEENVVPKETNQSAEAVIDESIAVSNTEEPPPWANNEVSTSVTDIIQPPVENTEQLIAKDCEQPQEQVQQQVQQQQVNVQPQQQVQQQQVNVQQPVQQQVNVQQPQEQVQQQQVNVQPQQMNTQLNNQVQQPQQPVENIVGQSGQVLQQVNQ